MSADHIDCLQTPGRKEDDSSDNDDRIGQCTVFTADKQNDMNTHDATKYNLTQTLSDLFRGENSCLKFDSVLCTCSQPRAASY